MLDVLIILLLIVNIIISAKALMAADRRSKRKFRRFRDQAVGNATVRYGKYQVRKERKQQQQRSEPDEVEVVMNSTPPPPSEEKKSLRHRVKSIPRPRLPRRNKEEANV